MLELHGSLKSWPTYERLVFSNVGLWRSPHLYAGAVGVASILSIEANTRAYLRCLVIKELLKLRKSQFVLGDFVGYLQNSKHYDLIVACGVLYHLVNPIEAIAYMSKATDQVYVWTQYYDKNTIDSQPMITHRFQSSAQSEYGGFRHTLHRQLYQTRLGNPGISVDPHTIATG